MDLDLTPDEDMILKAANDLRSPEVAVNYCLPVWAVFPLALIIIGLVKANSGQRGAFDSVIVGVTLLGAIWNGHRRLKFRLAALSLVRKLQHSATNAGLPRTTSV